MVWSAVDQARMTADRNSSSGIIARLLGLDAARDALFLIVPVVEKDEYVERALGHVRPQVVADSTVS